eukprot:1327184-Amorphochlora_amoeboformis.AAC.1
MTNDHGNSGNSHAVDSRLLGIFYLLEGSRSVTWRDVSCVTAYLEASTVHIPAYHAESNYATYDN